MRLWVSESGAQVTEHTIKLSHIYWLNPVIQGSIVAKSPLYYSSAQNVKKVQSKVRVGGKFCKSVWMCVTLLKSVGLSCAVV